jgi:hypothetical protein
VTSQGFGGSQVKGYFGSGGQLPGAQARPQTYDELLANDRLDHGERLRLQGEAVVSLAAHLLIGRGHDKIVGLLLDVERIEVEPREDRFDDDSLWLEVAPEHLPGFTEDVVSKIKEACSEIDKRKGYGMWCAGVREVLPELGPGWQDNLRQLLGGRPTNHARKIRIEPPRWVDDSLCFTNDGELAVYRALKKIQAIYPSDDTIGIFPLPGGRLPGKTWEPDVLVTYRKRAGVLEIDGPHHTGRRAMDMSRDSLFLDAGVAFAHRIPVEVLNDPRELDASLKKFLKRLAETR